MERDLWRMISCGLRRVPRWLPRNAVYSNRDVLAVLLWAALHDRPIAWACHRASWPPQAWRRRLPDQSTMSRRLRDALVWRDLDLLLRVVQRTIREGGHETWIVDGKALPVSGFSADADAAKGWGTGQFARGYKLHAIIDLARRVVAFDVRPLNEAESRVAREMIRRAAPAHGPTLLADASYDSTALYADCETNGVRLIAPRRKPGTGRGSAHRRTFTESRERAIEITEGPGGLWHRELKHVRSSIERFFGTLATPASGLSRLPPWVRRLHRVRPWVAAKLIVNAARLARIDGLRA